MDIDSMIEEARAELAPAIERLRGLGHVWSMFATAGEVAGELLRLQEQTSLWVIYSLTVAMAVEYAKPFGSNREPSLKALDRTFLAAIEATMEHNELLRYRNEAVAHLDSGVRMDGVGLIGASAINERPDTNPYEQLFVPGRVRLDVTMGLGLVDSEGIDSLIRHIRAAEAATNSALRDAAKGFRDTALRYAPVMHQLDDCVKLHTVAEGQDGNRQMPQFSEAPSPIQHREQELMLGGRRFRNVIVVREWTPPPEIDITGPGFAIKSTSSGTQVHYSAEFTQRP